MWSEWFATKLASLGTFAVIAVLEPKSIWEVMLAVNEVPL